MAMISKNAKQPMEGAASASMPWGAATGAKQTGSGSDGGAWSADMKAPKHMGNFRSGDTSGGPGGAIDKKVSVASEDVTKGMGGRVIKDMM
jgi:hypothetical protein